MQEDNIEYNKLVDDIFFDNYIDLYKLNSLSATDQSKVFSLVLLRVYSGNKDVNYMAVRKNALKCFKLSCSEKDEEEIHLPYNLIVRKKGNRMYFNFKDNSKRNFFLFIIVLGIFILSALGSTYISLKYLSVAHLNKDIDGDGIADLNIDIDNDEIEEINIEKNNDNKPSINIDYKGNRKPVFNVDLKNDGTATGNLINQDIDNDGKCDINCDINDDGWPDINIDIDGDGKVDLFVDINGDLTVELNFDTKGTGVCDVQCDTDGDEVCDKNCISNIEVIEKPSTGSSALVGNNQSDITTAEFIVEFVDDKLIKVNNLFPDDQEGEVNKKVVKEFYIHNKSPYYVRYNIELVVSKYTFESNNFQYKIVGHNGGYNSEYAVVPNSTKIINENEILIPPGIKQKYEVIFRLKGTNENQNYDQGKSFDGYFQIYIRNEL